jgi:hypothetical protein
MTKKYHLFITIFIIIGVLIGCKFLDFSATRPMRANPQVSLGTSMDQPGETTVQPDETTVQPDVLVGYPSNWPVDLRYPTEFSVRKAKAQTFPNSKNIALGAELQYTGNQKNAVEILSIFLTTKGWKIVEQTKLSTNETLVIFEDSKSSNQGIYTFKTDETNPNMTVISALIVIR